MVRPERTFSEPVINRYVAMARSRLNRIPPLSSRWSHGSSDIQIDTARSNILQGLVKVAEQQAQNGINPMEITDVVLPHVRQLRRHDSAIGIVLNLAATNATYGNDPDPLINEAYAQADDYTATYDEKRYYIGYYPSSLYSMIGEREAALGRDPQRAFSLASDRIGKEIEYAGDNAKGQVVLIDVVKETAKAAINAGHPELAQETLNKVPRDWGIIREVLDEELLPEIEASKGNQ